MPFALTTTKIFFPVYVRRFLLVKDFFKGPGKNCFGGKEKFLVREIVIKDFSLVRGESGRG
ncbi:hypothetical protein D7024_11855 [Desulfofundulus salinus]|uniref:Uncharacterized protein n=1 Tax=Desulfofundulus salinus TaxID=2419843 RepID=A0A494X3Z9_9FIRM|nr:hypothetical protein D7024_11855 [Desulfofundulus salinum]